MINSSFYGIISIILGILAVVFATYNIISVSKRSRLQNSWLATLSVVACVLCLYFEVLWTGHMIHTTTLDDLSKSYGLAQVATTVLVIVVFTLNIVGFILAKTNKPHHEDAPLPETPIGKPIETVEDETPSDASSL